MAWLSYFDDTYWQAAAGPPWRDFSANNWWESVSYTSGNLEVKTGETWNVGFKPTKIRLTFTVAGADSLISLNLLDSSLTQSWTGGVISDIATGQEIDISDPGADLEEMQMASFDGAALIITNIEFFTADIPKEVAGSQGGGANLGINNQGFGGFGFGGLGW